MSHTDQDMVVCHLPSPGKDGCVAGDAFSPPMCLAHYSKLLTNNGQLRKIMRNQKRPRFLSLKRKQQLALATTDLILLAPTPANVIPSDVLKQKLK